MMNAKLFYLAPVFIVQIMAFNRNNKYIESEGKRMMYDLLGSSIAHIGKKIISRRLVVYVYT